MTKWIFEPGHSEAEFRARHMMVTWVRGLLKDMRGELEFDLSDCMRTRFEGHLDATQLWTGEPDRDAHLRSAAFFDVANHPSIGFTGVFTERVDTAQFRAAADLTIRGITRSVPLDVFFLGEWATPFWVGEENRGASAGSASKPARGLTVMISGCPGKTSSTAAALSSQTRSMSCSTSKRSAWTI